MTENQTPALVLEEQRSCRGRGGSERSTPRAAAPASAREQHSPSQDACGSFVDCSLAANARRGVSFIEVRGDASEKGASPVEQRSELHGSEIFPSERRPHSNSRVDVPTQQRATAKDTGGRQAGATTPGKAGGPATPTGSASEKLKRRALPVGKAAFLTGQRGDVDDERRRGNNKNQKYIYERSSPSRAITEPANACSILLTDEDSAPLFLRAPVRLLASWKAHNDGLKSMQLLPLSNRRRRPTASKAAETIAEPAQSTGAFATTAAYMSPAATKAAHTAAAAAQEGIERAGVSMTALGTDQMLQASLRCKSNFGRNAGSSGRRRILLLTAGGDGAARVWDVSGISSDVTMPALFLDIADAAITAKSMRQPKSRALLSSAAPFPFGIQPPVATIQNVPLLPLPPSVETFPAALTFASSAAAQASTADPTLPFGSGAAEATERANHLLLRLQQLGEVEKQEYTIRGTDVKNVSKQLQPRVLLVGDLHAQSSNAIAAAAGEAHAADIPAARGVPLQQPRRLWQLDLDKEDDEVADSDQYRLYGEEASSPEDSQTEGEYFSHKRLLQLHMSVKKMEEQQRQLSERRADIHTGPSLMLGPPSACQPKEETSIDFLTNDVLALALAQKKSGNSSTNSN